MVRWFMALAVCACVPVLVGPVVRLVKGLVVADDCHLKGLSDAC